MKTPPFRPYYTIGTLTMEQRHLVSQSLGTVIDSVIGDRSPWDTCAIYDREGKVVWTTEEMCYKCRHWVEDPGLDGEYPTGDFYCLKANHPDHRCPEFEWAKEEP